MIQRNYMMSAHRLSDVRHSQLLGRLSFLPARREFAAAVIRSTRLGALGSCVGYRTEDDGCLSPRERAVLRRSTPRALSLGAVENVGQGLKSESTRCNSGYWSHVLMR